ncbi:alkaline phosphatase D family protein [Marinobacter sp.]|uniref:alkaline phosphatase D family protein n=1 Tax=Marinobacter sp. TaxID=50741 RepID=UPI002B27546E|nr:alkaline phosphatase D family protein [Marinobacter sp.]
MKRREFLVKGSAAGASLVALSACNGAGSGGAGVVEDSSVATVSDADAAGSSGFEKPVMPDWAGPSPFQHGVASGDPLARQVILWTRVTAEGFDEVPVIVRVSRDPELSNVVYEGVGYARSEADYTVKIDAMLPESDTTWFYQFESLGYFSPIGRTKTTAHGHQSVEHLRLAVMACANYSYGFFNAYRKVAFRRDLDAVLFLGDYIYEYGPGEYSDPEVEQLRPLDPPHEIVTLSDYRCRYALNRTDDDLQECHRQHPFICVWDDHEIANDAWVGGAENHNEGDGDYAGRKRAAVQAYYEWMPIRPVLPDRQVRIYRSFEFGQLASLMMLDTRLIGRDQQTDSPVTARDRNRSLLGDDQQKWLFEQMEHSQTRGAQWHLLGQQVMLAPLTLGALPDMPNLDLGGGAQVNYDQWDGYETSRRALLGRIEAMGLDNAVVLTGDIHSSWAMDISLDPGNWAAYNRFTGEGSLAVEFVTPAVTSPGAPSKGVSDLAKSFLIPANPHIKWLDFYHRGYMVVDITPERCQADWFHLETVSEPSNQEQFAIGWYTASGDNHVQVSHAPCQPKRNAPPLAPEQKEQMEVLA